MGWRAEWPQALPAELFQRSLTLKFPHELDRIFAGTTLPHPPGVLIGPFPPSLPGRIFSGLADFQTLRVWLLSPGRSATPKAKSQTRVPGGEG